MAYRHLRRNRWSSSDNDEDKYAAECVREALEKARHVETSAETSSCQHCEPGELEHVLQKYMQQMQENPDLDERQIEDVYRDIQDLPGLPEYILNEVRDANLEALGVSRVEEYLKQSQRELNSDRESDVGAERVYVSSDTECGDYHKRRVNLPRYNNNNNYEPSEQTESSVGEPHYVVREVVEVENPYERYERYERHDAHARSVEDLRSCIYSPREHSVGPSYSDTRVTSPSKHHLGDYERRVSDVPDWLEGHTFRKTYPDHDEQEHSTDNKLNSYFTIEKLKAEVKSLQKRIRTERVDAFEKAQKFHHLKAEAMQERIYQLCESQQDVMQDNKQMHAFFDRRLQETNDMLHLQNDEILHLRQAIHDALSEKVTRTGKLGRRLNQNVLKAHQQVTNSLRTVSDHTKKIEHLRQLILRQQMYIIDLEQAFREVDEHRMRTHLRRLQALDDVTKQQVLDGKDRDDVEIPTWEAAMLPHRVEKDDHEIRLANITEVLGQDRMFKRGQIPAVNSAVTFCTMALESQGDAYVPQPGVPFGKSWENMSYLTHLQEDAAANQPRKVYEEPEVIDLDEPERKHYLGDVGVTSGLEEELREHMQRTFSVYHPAVVEDNEWPTHRDYEY